MSEIKDFECMVEGCPADADQLIETDPNWETPKLIVLCQRHYYAAQQNPPVNRGVMIGGDVLICDSAGSWFFLPG